MAQLIAIAASQAGPAHGYTLGEALRAAAERLGHELKLRVHSRFGVQDECSDADLAQADAVIVARDDGFEFDRRGLPADRLYEVRPEAVFEDAADVVARALARHAGAPLPPSRAGAGSLAAAAARPLRIVAITSCPTGVAHTFMAAEALEQGARALGHQIQVETQGSVGAQNRLGDAAIAEADLVLIAADTQVDRSRFAGKPLFAASTKQAIHDAGALIDRARREATAWRADGAAGAGAGTGVAAGAAAASQPTAAGPYKHLMTGVSFMLPFVVAGGLLIALAFALGGIYVHDDAHRGTLGWILFQIGSQAAFTLMVPALAGYIAFSIADRPGLAPGMIGGLLATTVGAGFLGGIAAGFVAGYAVQALNRWIRLPRGLEGLKPVLILPLLGSAVVGVAMLMLLGQPIAAIMSGLTEWLKGLQSGSALLLGVTLGAMMAADMGGPINKAAYVFSTSLIASGVATPMAAAMAAGMVPPLGIALACRLFPGRFSAEEREASKAAAVLGLAFITEGAIPYVARDPLRVIPACVLGAATTGALSMLWGIALQAPHGGVFVLAIPNAVNHVLLYGAAIVIGMAVNALALGVLKRRSPANTVAAAPPAA